jgi:hypothetical protein
VATVPASAAPADMTGYSIVIIGKFDPSLVQPSILLKNGLINEGDAAGLTYEALMKDLAVLSMPWITLAVEPEKLSASSTAGYPVGEPIRDFVLDLLDIMPVKQYNAIGINRDTHLPLQSNETYDALVERLGGFGRGELGPMLADIDEASGKTLVNLRMNSLSFQAQRDDGTHGSVSIRIERSVRIVPGVYVQINDHFEADPAVDTGPDELVKRLTDGWAASNRRADVVVSAIRMGLSEWS